MVRDRRLRARACDPSARGLAVHELDEALVCPIPWHQMQRFEQPGDAGDLVAEWRWGVMLSNNSATDGLRARTREEMLSGDTLLGDLLQRALRS